MLPVIMITFLLRLITAFKIFAVPFTLTAGGPGKVIKVYSISASLAVCLGSLAGYALARFRFGRLHSKDITLWFLAIPSPNRR